MAVIYRNHLRCSRVSLPTCDTIEAVCVRLTTAVILLNIYRQALLGRRPRFTTSRRLFWSSSSFTSFSSTSSWRLMICCRTTSQPTANSTPASPHLWNQLPVSFHQLCIKHSADDVTISDSSPTCSPLSPSITRSLFHSRLKTHLFHKSFPS